jgi:hypothetical protein
VQENTRPPDWIAKDKDIHYQNFSDLCITATPVKGDAVPFHSQGIFFLELLGLIHAQVGLLGQGVFVRGGITIGPLVKSYNVLYGPGLVKAYELEQTAQYPRIIVDPAALNMIRNDPIYWVHDRKTEMNAIHSLLKVEEGISFLDYVRAIASELDEPEHEYPEFLMNHKRLIELNLALHANSQRVRQKYEWLARYHNNVINERLKPEARWKYSVQST